MNITKHIKEHIALQTDPFKSANRAGLPYGSWMSDTFQGADIYAMGFDKRPTVFFDPSDISSLGWGTYKEPFTTKNELAQWVLGKSGNLAGQVLGMKRGSRITGGLTMAGIYGSSASPFYVIPYGDAEAMPIISGGTVYTRTDVSSTGWAVTSNPAIYKVDLTSDCDVFDQTYSGLVKRLIKTSEPVASEAAAIAALVAAGAGHSVYDNTTSPKKLYIYPFAGEPDWTQIEVMTANYAWSITLADVATTGNVTLAGFHVRGARASCMYTTLTAFTALPTAENITVIGCQASQAGYESVSNAAACVGIIINSASDTYRIANLQLIGNYVYDNLTNGTEVSGVSSGHEWGNKVYHADQGIEMYNAVSLMQVHDNYIYGNFGGRTQLKGGNGSGIKLFGRNTAGSTDTAINTGCKYYRNIVINQKAEAISHIGAAGLAYNNTIQGNNASGNTGIRADDDVTSHTCALNVRNNIIRGTKTSGNGVLLFGGANVSLAGVATNSFSNPGASETIYDGGVGKVGIGAWNTYALATYGTGTDINTNPTLASDGYTPTAEAMWNVGTVIAGYTERDWKGRPMLANGTDTKPALGAVARP